jgi:hypothetical protein
VTVLQDHEFELLATEAEADGIPFGLRRAISCNADGFDPGVAEWITQDTENPLTGTTHMGRDVLKGSTWTWQLFANRSDPETAVQALADLGRVWLNRKKAREPDAVSVMRYKLAGRTRRVYGRPRRWGATMTNQILSGMVPITCDFQRVDPLFYDDSPEIDTLDMISLSEGGITFPVVFPAASVPSGTNEGEIWVGGDEPTWPIIRFTGPIINPELITPAWTLKLNTTILDGGWIEIDTRPWVMTVKNQAGYSVSGVLDPKVRFSKMELEPGHYSLAMRGDSSSNTATCIIKRYAAYATI